MTYDFKEIVKRIVFYLGHDWDIIETFEGENREVFAVHLEHGGVPEICGLSMDSIESAYRNLVDQFFVTEENSVYKISKVSDLVSKSYSELELKLTLKGF